MRRDGRTFAAGALILGALAADHLAGWTGLGGPLMVAAAVVAGWGVARRALASLSDRHVSIELLVTVAAGGALVIGEYWEAAAVTFLFELGAYLERRTLRSTRSALGELLEMAPERALVERDGETVEVRPREVAPGELVVVRPGARVPVDGVVRSGSAAVDQGMITGEPMPVDKLPGDRVFAGTVSRSGLLRVEATGVGADTTLARVIRRVEQAQESKAPAQRFMERFARWYTPAIIGASGVALLVTGDIRLALTLLVIGCPGALVISTPVSIVAGIGRAARAGILIKGGQYLEQAARIEVMAFDKTGTLTEGRPRLTEVRPYAPSRPGATAGRSGGSAAARPFRRVPDRDDVDALVAAPAGLPGPGLPPTADDAGDPRWTPEQARLVLVAATAEAGSDHPLAQPVVESARTLAAIEAPDTLEEIPGRGVVAGHRGREIAVGTEALLRDLEIPVPPDVAREVAELRERGRTVSLVAVDGRLAGYLGLSDPPRPEARAALRRLRRAGVRRLVMLTGDAEPAAAAVAGQVGVDEVHAGLLPEDKLTRIRELRRGGAVVGMVGDGINDAPALAAADVSVAMGAAGTDTALETADLALLADDLLKLPVALRLSRATRHNIRQNVAIALVTVGVLLAGVLAGEIHMAGGMLVHEASVLAVIVNAMRLLRSPTTLE